LAKLFKLENQQADMVIIGIVSSENDYKISWALNESLRISLKRNENIKSPSPKTEVISEFPFYTFEAEETAAKYILIQNRNKSFFYIHELKKFDYLFIILGDHLSKDSSAFLQTLKSNSLLSSSFTINPENIKNQNKIRLL
jgi:hypothetical protein